MEEAHRSREVVDVPEWVGNVILECSGELLVGCFGCAFDVGVVCENVCVKEGGVLAPHFSKNTLEFLCFGNPGGKAVYSLFWHLGGGGESEEKGDVGGMALPLMPTYGGSGRVRHGVRRGLGCDLCGICLVVCDVEPVYA